MAFILTTVQKVTATVSFVDASGAPARVDGVPSWSSSDPSVTIENVSADGMSADVVAQSIGTAQVSVSADADMGAGVRPVTAVADIEVQAAEAVSAAIGFGAPVLK
jgi:hypothetical protein